MKSLGLSLLVFFLTNPTAMAVPCYGNDSLVADFANTETMICTTFAYCNGFGYNSLSGNYENGYFYQSCTGHQTRTVDNITCQNASGVQYNVENEGFWGPCQVP